MISQLVANALIAASHLALLSVGFGLIYGCGRFFHFAHGAIFAFGGYTAFLLVQLLSMPAWFAFSAAPLIAAGLGAVLELVAYRPLRVRGATGLVMLIASMGAYIVIQHALALGFGDDTKRIQWKPSIMPIEILGGRLTGLQVTTIALSVVVLGVLCAILHWTRYGKLLRAVADNPELAIIIGIDSAHVLLAASVIGSFLAGIAGLLFALEVNLTPTMGMTPLLLAVVAVIVGGIGSRSGTILASIAIGVLQQAAVWVLSSEWQEAVVYALLLALLLIRPEGLARRRPAKWSL
ncbi:MAG: branched-chain amino acid ABC transporter permease [Acidobacteriia bacterium]|nr:branched-chain amino acid ABC transporter permease [Terriglobia bacterium]